MCQSSLVPLCMKMSASNLILTLNHQAWLNNKCCPRVAAISCTQRSTKTDVTLTFDMILKYNRVLEVVEVMQNYIKQNAQVQKLSW